eukprot:3013877-Amphidinium_carterae.1
MSKPPMQQFDPLTASQVMSLERVRPIDDFARSLVNAAGTTREKIAPDSVDVIAATAAAAARITQTTACHSEYSEWESALQLSGRTLDLDAAYKQCPFHPQDRRFAVIALLRVTGTMHFVSNALPFGATAAVNQFNRISMAVKIVALKLLRLTVTAFYDDFVQFDLQRTSLSAHIILEVFCNAVGLNLVTHSVHWNPYPRVPFGDCAGCTGGAAPFSALLQWFQGGDCMYFHRCPFEPCVTAVHGIEIVLGGVLFLGGSGVIQGQRLRAGFVRIWCRKL